VIVREATEDDFDALMALYRQLHPEDPVLTDGRDRAVFERVLHDDDLRLFVLVDGDHVLATCYLNIIPNITRSARPYAIVENVVTEQSLRGRGHGKRVIAHALEFAWRRGCYKAMLQTGSKQEATHAFYRSCGFSGTEKTGYIARPPVSAGAGSTLD